VRRAFIANKDIVALLALRLEQLVRQNNAPRLAATPRPSPRHLPSATYTVTSSIALASEPQHASFAPAARKQPSAHTKRGGRQIPPPVTLTSNLPRAARRDNFICRTLITHRFGTRELTVVATVAPYFSVRSTVGVTHARRAVSARLPRRTHALLCLWMASSHTLPHFPYRQHLCIAWTFCNICSRRLFRCAAACCTRSAAAVLR